MIATLTRPAPVPASPLAAVRLVAVEMGKREAAGKKWLLAHPVSVKEVKCKADLCPTCDMQTGCQHREWVSKLGEDENPGMVKPFHWQGTVVDASAMVRLYAHIRSVQRASMRVQMLDQLITRADAKRQDDDESATLIREMAEAWSRYETAKAVLEMAEGEMGR